MQELSVVSGRDSFLLFEQAAEIHGILIPNDCGDLGDVIIRRFQKTGRVIDAVHQNVVHRRHSCDLLEIS